MEVTSATEKSMLENKLRELEFSKSRLEREKQSLEGDLAASQKEIIGLKCSIAEMSSSSSGLRAELDSCQRQLTAEKGDNCKLRSDLSTANTEISELQVSRCFKSNFYLFIY